MRCVVCGNEMEKNSTGICEVCGYNIKLANNISGRTTDIERHALAYLNDKLPLITDEKLKEDIEEVLYYHENGRSVGSTNSASYSSTSGWISFMEVVIWLVAIAAFVGSISLALEMESIMIFIFGVAVSLFTVAGSMIFLGIAADIRKSRALLEEIRDLEKNK